MLLLTSWMQPSPQGKASDSGLEPQKQTLLIDIAAGVFSETWDYSEVAKVRKELLSAGTGSDKIGSFYALGVR